MSLEAVINYTFKDSRLLEIALSHPSQKSFASEYQRYEFLGDSILSGCISKYLYHYFRDADEGTLNIMRTAIVNGTSLSQKALELKIDQYIKLSEVYRKNFGAPSYNMLEDTFEALIAAIYLDSKLETVENWILDQFQKELKYVREKIKHINPKGALQEWSQLKQQGSIPSYIVKESLGPDHNKSYTVEVLVEGKVLGSGTNSSIKNAEIDAALDALNKIH